MSPLQQLGLMRGGADGSPLIAGVSTGRAPTRHIAWFGANDDVGRPGGGNGEQNAADRNDFKIALYATLERKAKGVLTPYLFYDPPEEDTTVNYKSDWGAQESVPYGAASWDEHIAQSYDEGDADAYGFTKGDTAVIKTAIQKGLLQNLPSRIAYYSYGPGELIAVRTKDFPLIDAIAKNSKHHSIESLTAVDINGRYARTFADAANRRYGPEAKAIQGNFMQGTLDLQRGAGTSVIAVFGGPFANAPSTEHISAKQNAARYLAQLVSQHGEGTRVIITIDTQSDEQILLKEYAPTKPFEAFVLGAFPRAVKEQIIKRPYDVFGFWKLKTKFNADAQAIELIAEAKSKHQIQMEDRKFNIRKGDEFVITLSHKWPTKDWTNICKAAGLDDPEFFGDGPRKLLLARAGSRKPDLSLVF